MVASSPTCNSSDQELEPYVYTTLIKGQIRVLELSPADQEADQLRGRLLVKDLKDLPPRRKPFSSDLAEPIDPTKHVCFEALSYVWGEGGFTESLVTPSGFIPVTPSLASILRRLRHSEHPRLYWADGVCINQNDVAEKEIQVPLMGIIYSSAVRVLCDVCGENGDFDLLLDTMELYWKKNIRRGFELSQGLSMTLSKETSAAIFGVQLPTEEEADAIEDFEMEDLPGEFLRFISSPWFHRLWILQEFVLGRDVTMIFGRRHLPWGQLWASTVCYLGADMPWDSLDIVKPENRTKLTSLNSICFIRSCRVVSPDTDHGREFLKATKVVMGGADLNQAQFPMSLIAGCFKQCTVPRDRYFAILGLINEDSHEEVEKLQVDYTSPIRDITMRFWKRALQLSSGGELILIAGLTNKSEGYPSWLRDITVPSPLNGIWQSGPLSNAWHKTGGDLGTWSPAFSDNDPNKMTVQAYLIDEVAEVSSTAPADDFYLEAMVIWLESAIAFFTSENHTDKSHRNLRYPSTGESIQDAVIKTVCGFNSQSASGDTFTSIHEACQSLISITASYPDKGEDMIEAIYDNFEDSADIFTDLFTRVFSMRGLRFSRTEKGMFAMLPKEVRVGDSIWAVKGCRLPIILRPSLEDVGSFEIVGCGYLYGVMSGEVMEIPGFTWEDISLR
ncbi:Heterokaryon incompatibility protein [Fusarium longipes]|uniref:Heterokaryon incompatibility protein n=1 Tax=Fusarium longipes TaxID=694270 RepID=A0A395T2D9_9HYPO|nr:Heterokaryon incompatibility protein [Fusarium longipes]